MNRACLQLTHHGQHKFDTAADMALTLLASSVLQQMSAWLAHGVRRWPGVKSVVYSCHVR